MPEEPEGPPFNPSLESVPFTLVDVNGQVMQRGSSMFVPEIAGLTQVNELAPDNAYRDGGAWVTMPARPDSDHVFDWATKTWSDSRTLADRKQQLVDAVTAKRWNVENGGLTLPSGLGIKTAQADQARITAVLTNMANAGITSIDFKSAVGWVTLTLAQLQGIAAAIALHVQACFTAERAHHETIGSFTTLEEVAAYQVNVGWPT